ncbi:copper resistance CopC family protein [Acidisoma sp. 7E03]
MSGILLATLPTCAQAEPPAFLSSVPAAGATVPGSAAGMSIRFSRPIDHLHSSLAIVQSGVVVAALHPLADSAADVLFARRGPLKPGAYQLHWTVRSLDGQHTLTGDVAFSVK